MAKVSLLLVTVAVLGMLAQDKFPQANDRFQAYKLAGSLWLNPSEATWRQAGEFAHLAYVNYIPIEGNVVNWVARDRSIVVRVEAGRTTQNRRLLARLADHTGITESSAVASNPHTPGWVLRKLTKVDSRSVFSAVLANPQCPKDILGSFLQDEATKPLADLSALEAVLSNEGTPLQAFEHAAVFAVGNLYNARFLLEAFLNNPSVPAWLAGGINEGHDPRKTVFDHYLNTDEAEIAEGLQESWDGNLQELLDTARNVCAQTSV